MIRLLAFVCSVLLAGGLAVAWGQGNATIPSPATPPLASPSPTPGGAGAEPIVMAARIGEHADSTRFVVEVSDPLKVRVFTLANPDRVVIDMPEVLWRLSAADHPSGRGAVKSYRYGLFRPGNSRFVIDLRAPVTPSVPMILPPSGGNGFRIVLDLSPTTQPHFEQMAGWPADLRAREAEAERVAALPIGAVASAPIGSTPHVPHGAPKHIIVLDAGHGGIDAGTIGYDGLLEKNLVLDETLRLRKALLKRGYAVHLTRETDTYIPLEERVNIARGEQADLFISLHADSNPDPAVRGASVYTLSESGSDRAAAALARKENQSDMIAGVDLSGQNSPVASILIGLVQRDTMNRSARFALSAVTELSHATDILPRDPHRAAGFVVLKAPDVPAVLIELGYLSNPRDCAQMGTAPWRDKVAAAIADAVNRQFRAAIPDAEPATAQALDQAAE